MASPLVSFASIVSIASGAAALCLAAAPAAAGPLELGALFGPHRFSDQSVLGQSDTMPTSLGSTVIVGVRVGKPLTSWLAVEGEVALTPATTVDYDLGVFWIEPRAQLRFQLPGDRLHPFFVLGAGMPSAVSNNTTVFPSGVTEEGYGGAGVAFRPGRGIGLRLDLRVSILPSRDTADFAATAEGELMAGLWFELGGKKAPRIAGPTAVAAAPVDTDGDGIPDADDQCPTRPEDKDGRDDADGCPDIDDDGDLVLDIADKCPTEAETFNGFEDDDGCPDTVPPDVDGIIGTIEGLNYEPGVTDVAPTAQPTLDMITEILRRHPSIRLVIVGHTDATEAVDAAPRPAEGEPALDPELLATQLGQARAQAVRNEFVKRGVGSSRLVVVSAGLGEPVSDDSPRGRARNRRVELRLFTPRRETH
ncbi:MAG TPA: OmpA family protein [Kofleriaceae bacterium]|nr:OmpA family protein [Kofleriaceae bacterium]